MQPSDQQTETPKCPKCSGDMWDNRESKRNPKAPDFKCKDKGCDGVIWPPREGGAAPADAQGGDTPACPICGGKMWDDRATKRNPRAPDFKCRNKPKFQGGPGCPGVIWPPRDGERRPAASAATRAPAAAPRPRPEPRDEPREAPPQDDFQYREFSDDELPF